MSRGWNRHFHCRAGARQLRLFATAGAGACLLTAGTAAWTPGVAQGQASSLTFTVDTTADAHDVHPGDGICADAAGQCTLRAALEEAAVSPPGSTVSITAPAGTYDLTLGSLTLGSASVPMNITVDGAGAASTVVAATGKFRVMAVTPHATGLLENVEITGGKAGPNSYGGGIYSQGVLTLAHDSLRGNTAGAGGGVGNAGGTLTVTGSTIENNNGGVFGGGGIQNGGPQNVPGTVVVRSSTLTGNVTSNEGGGIFSGQNGRPAAAGQAAVAPARRCAPSRCAAPRAAAAAGLVLRVINSTVSGNRGGNGGGGIAAEDSATLTGSRVDNNSAGGAIGGGVFNVGTVTDSTISGNTADTGGAVEDFPGLFMTITDSTLDGNHAAANGGALDVNQQITVTDSTLAGNEAGGKAFKGMGAAAELDGGGTLIVSDSTIAGSTTQPAAAARSTISGAA